MSKTKTDELEMKKVRKRKTKQTVAVAGSVLTAMNATAVPMVALAQEVTEVVQSAEDSVTPEASTVAESNVTSETSTVTENSVTPEGLQEETPEEESGNLGVYPQTIKVYGIGDYHKFDISINWEDKKLELTLRDPLIMMHDYYVDRTYFQITVYRGEDVVFEQSLIGTDKPNKTEFVQSFEGFTFEEGDYIKIYHGEPDNNRLQITGNPLTSERGGEGLDYNSGISSEKLYNSVYLITENGLKEYYNEKPTFVGVNNPLYVLQQEDGITEDEWLSILKSDVTAFDDRNYLGALAPNSDITNGVTVVNLSNLTDDVGVKNAAHDATNDAAPRYKVTDSWRREEFYNRRNVYVLPSTVQNVPGVDFTDKGAVILPNSSTVARDRKSVV